MSPSRLNKFGFLAMIFAALSAIPATLRAFPPAAPSTAGEYRVLKTYEVGGEGRWDYLAYDPVGKRLFVTRESHVMVIDPTTGKVLGDIPDLQGVHGVAFAQNEGRGFISCGRSASAPIFDLKTRKVLGKVSTGENPDAIVYEPVTKCVFTMNGRGRSATAIDAATGKEVGTVDLGGKPEFSVADDAGKLFVNLEDKSEIVVLDPKALKVTARWSIAPGEEPSGMAIDVKNHRLFSVCDNKMMVVVDADTGKVLATPAIGEHPDAAIFDAESGLAFSSNGDGTLTIVREESPSKFTIAQNVATMRGARTMAMDPETHHLFMPTAKFGPTPTPTKERPRQRPSILPDSFQIIVVGK
jgi:DNA-binding beta-propeller fold protein YncE